MIAVHPLRAIGKALDDGFEAELEAADLSDTDEQHLRELSPAYKIGRAYNSFIGTIQRVGRKVSEFSYSLLPC